MKSQKELIDIYESLLRELPQGRLVFKHISGHIYYYHIAPGTSKQQYISVKNIQLIEDLKTRRYIEEALARLKKNVKEQEKLIKKYRSYNAADILKGLGKAYCMAPYISSKVECYPIKKANTGEDEYSRMVYRREGLLHKTIFGIKVRSKSEVLIAEMLYKYGIEFEYEKPLHLVDMNHGMQIRYPDFTIYSKGTVIYWEHLGMMKDRNYRNAFYKKLELYYENDIIPGSNLIITEDGKQGNIDLQGISAIIGSLAG